MHTIYFPILLKAIVTEYKTYRCWCPQLSSYIWTVYRWKWRCVRVSFLVSSNLLGVRKRSAVTHPEMPPAVRQPGLCLKKGRPGLNFEKRKIIHVWRVFFFFSQCARAHRYVCVVFCLQCSQKVLLWQFQVFCCFVFVLHWNLAELKVTSTTANVKSVV